MKSKVKTKKDKIELICYCANDIEFRFDKINKKYIITKPFKFIPCDLLYTENGIKNIINVLLKGNPQLKITIERCKSNGKTTNEHDSI